MIISRSFLLRIRNISDKPCTENPNNNFIPNNFFFSRKSCCLWDNVEKYCTARQATDDNITRRMRFACRVTKATNTHSECLILIVFQPQQWLHERVSMLCHTTLPVVLYYDCALHFVDRRWTHLYLATYQHAY